VTKKLPTGRFRRAFDLARVGAQAGASWAMARGTDAAAKKSAEVLGNLRGLAAKVGQTASYVDGLIPADQRATYEKALSKLQEATPPSSTQEVLSTILSEFGRPVSELFSDFEQEPRASASIGQVHRATLHDGTEVAVKVQHAGIEEAVESDLKNVGMLEGLISLAGPRGLKAGAIFDEVLLRFRQELDYRIEARNQNAFQKLHAADPDIRIPDVFETLCTKRVFTSRWVHGLSLEEAVQAPADIRKKYARTLWRFVFKGNLVGGAFNADPHPGNYIFHEDGGITFLDFGCVQPIPEAIRRAAVRAHLSAIEGNHSAFEGSIAEMLGTRGGEYGRATEIYTRRCFEPLWVSPFRITPAYAAELFGEVRTLKKAMLAKDGSFAAPPPELALMNRLQFGFYSVIAKLNVEVDYRGVEQEFLDEAVAIEQGRLLLT
jgi:predicted unusual protein kinase regulating ubiquinone biosynthesis (AarF/ABC1/UbiB family)